MVRNSANSTVMKMVKSTELRTDTKSVIRTEFSSIMSLVMNIVTRTETGR